MRRLALFSRLLLLGSAVSLAAAESPQTVTVIYSDGLEGRIEARTCCALEDCCQLTSVQMVQELGCHCGWPGGGLAARARLVDQLRTETPALLLLELGDALAQGGDPAADTALLAHLQRMGYAALGMGRQEATRRDWLAKHSPLPLLASQPALGGQPDGLPCHLVREPISGLQVGLLRLTAPADQPGEAGVPAVIRAAQQELTHLPAEGALRLALVDLPPEALVPVVRAVPEVDVWLWAHQTANQTRPVRLGAAWVAGVQRGGTYLGRLDLTFAGQVLVDVTGTTLHVDGEARGTQVTACRTKPVVDVELLSEKPR